MNRREFAPMALAQAPIASSASPTRTASSHP